MVRRREYFVREAGEWLFKRVKECRSGTITIVTPWFSNKPVLQVLDLLAPGVRLRFVFRWPAQYSDCWYLDRGALEALMEDERVDVEFVLSGLHAKVYVVGDEALVTSANLTGAGLTTNFELGVTCAADAVLEQLRADDLPTVRLDDERHRQLIELIGLAGDAGGMTQCVQPNLEADRIAFARRVFTSVGRPDAQRIEQTKGQNAWHVRLLRRAHAIVKVQTSVSNDHGGYHFAVTRQTHQWMRNRELHGLVLLPTTHDLQHPPDAPVMVVVPGPLLVDARRGVASASFGKSGTLTMMVERAGRGWQLRIPGAGRRRGAVARLHRHGTFSAESGVYTLHRW